MIAVNRNPGYHFASWNDGVLTDHPRTDTNVISNITVSANFCDQYLHAYLHSRSKWVDQRDLTADSELR